MAKRTVIFQIEENIINNEERRFSISKKIEGDSFPGADAILVTSMMEGLLEANPERTMNDLFIDLGTVLLRRKLDKEKPFKKV